MAADERPALTHVDEKGRLRMVDVGEKPLSRRRATARAVVTMAPETARRLRELPKGDALASAQVAGIMAAKRTHELIPLCHPLLISKVKVDCELDENLPGVRVSAEVKVSGQTGVEMEALTAVSVACLTVYDMVKAVDKGMRIENVRLRHKSGGRSGTYQAP